MRWRKRVGEEEANKISHQAATRGTSVHKLAEDYIDNVDDWKGKAMPNNLYTFSHLKDIIDKRLDNVWFQEEYLYSDRLKCAGQVDCIAEFDGELSIVDFKTARKPKKIEWITNYFIQASFYAAAFYERTGVPIRQGVILITVDHNEPQIFKINTHEYLQQFLDVRQKYKELKENG
jgi:genome maintenance exonuclease 1